MNNDVLFISNRIGKAILFAQRDVIVKSYCSLSRTCSLSDRCQSCSMIDEAKIYLANQTSNSSIEVLDCELTVGIGEYKIGKRALLEALGLGSCIGLILYDISAGISGIAHILLPGASQNGETKYAETAIEIMLGAMIKQGARKSRIVSKFAGGANVFKHINMEILKIGNRNAISVEETLNKKKIPILAKDVGGDTGRTVIFNPLDGTMIVKYTKGEILWL
jgi:chemotaxis protein CheD